MHVIVIDLFYKNGDLTGSKLFSNFFTIRLHNEFTNSTMHFCLGKWLTGKDGFATRERVKSVKFIILTGQVSALRKLGGQKASFKSQSSSDNISAQLVA